MGNLWVGDRVMKLLYIFLSIITFSYWFVYFCQCWIIITDCDYLVLFVWYWYQAFSYKLHNANNSRLLVFWVVVNTVHRDTFKVFVYWWNQMTTTDNFSKTVNHYIFCERTTRWRVCIPAVFLFWDYISLWFVVNDFLLFSKQWFIYCLILCLKKHFSEQP